MRIVLSAAVSADGFLNRAEGERLVLSSEEDWRAVHELRAECDAILVGAETVRRDNPALVIRDPALRAARVAAGRAADIIKVTVSAGGRLDPGARFFTEGTGEKIVFTLGAAGGGTDIPQPRPASAEVNPGAADGLRAVAQVIELPEINARTVAAGLRARGVGALMVEGGSRVLSMFLAEGEWDELRLAVAPMLVGDGRAPRLVADGAYPAMTLARTEQLGQMAVMHLENRSQARTDYRRMARAVENSLKSPASGDRYRVGAVIVTADGSEFDGYTGETAPSNHAEEEALNKAVAAGAELHGATIYASMEPCSSRVSHPRSCSELIMAHRFTRVVYALREPDRFTHGTGVETLTTAGVEVAELAGFAPDVARANEHVLI
jgi:riboflavin-specific deaminase-like protein